MVAINKFRRKTAIQAPLTVGKDDTGYDVKFFGATSGAYMLWDESVDDLVFTGAASVTIGNSTTDKALGTSITERAFQVFTSSTSTDADDSIRPIFMRHTVLGTGGVGHRAEFHTRCDVAAGPWINALKGYMEFDVTLTAGRTTGLASAICAEMKMPNSAVGTGEYWPLEIELVGQGSTGTGVSAGFITCRATGTLTNWNANAYFFQVTGLTAGATAMLGTGSQTLKCLIGTHAAGTAYYLLMSTTTNAIVMGASAAPVGDFYYYGTLASSYIQWDVSEDRFVVQNTFASDANVSTYEYGQYIGMAFNTSATTGKYIAGLKIAMEGTGDYDSGTQIYPLWIDFQNVGTNSASEVCHIMLQAQASACLPDAFIKTHVASPGVPHFVKFTQNFNPIVNFTAAGKHGGVTKKISIDIAGTEYFLLASTVPVSQ